MKVEATRTAPSPALRIGGHWYDISGTQQGPLREGLIAMDPEDPDAPRFTAYQMRDGAVIQCDDMCGDAEICRAGMELLASVSNEAAAEAIREIIASRPPAWELHAKL